MSMENPALFTGLRFLKASVNSLCTSLDLNLSELPGWQGYFEAAKIAEVVAKGLICSALDSEAGGHRDSQETQKLKRGEI